LIEEWTGQLIGKMHNNGVTTSDVAQELGVTRAYVSMILNCVRKPADAQSRLEAAVETIISRRSESAS
jgi:predicted transcriptional regulator